MNCPARHHPRGEPNSFAAAADACLERHDLAATTMRAYGATFGRVGDQLGDRALGSIDEGDLAGVLDDLWDDAAPSTYNRHRAALSSLWAWTTARGWTPTTT